LPSPRSRDTCATSVIFQRARGLMMFGQRTISGEQRGCHMRVTAGGPRHAHTLRPLMAFRDDRTRSLLVRSLFPGDRRWRDARVISDAFGDLFVVEPPLLSQSHTWFRLAYRRPVSMTNVSLTSHPARFHGPPRPYQLGTAVGHESRTKFGLGCHFRGLDSDPIG
jgi:hypothetical protein